jgi:hypothetical protein
MLTVVVRVVYLFGPALRVAHLFQDVVPVVKALFSGFLRADLFRPSKALLLLATRINTSGYISLS